MAATIDLTIKVDLAQVADTHDHLTAMAKSLTGWSDDVNGQRSKALGDWEGFAATAFGNTASFYRDDLDELQKTVTALGNAVNTIHGSVTSVKNACAGMLDEARKAKPTVSGSIITLPDSPTFAGPVGAPLPASAQQQLSAYGDMQKKFDDLAKRAKEQGKDLADAHITLQEACEKVEAPKGITVSKPKEASERVDEVNELREKLKGTGSLLKAGIMALFGTPAYRGAHAVGWVPKLKDKINLGNWIPKTDTPEGIWKAAEGLEKAEPYLDKANYALSAVSGAFDAKKQWDIDSHDPSMNTAEKIGDSVAVGLADTAPKLLGGIGGEVIGEALFGAAGTAIGGPAGTVVGAAIGGALGSWAGSELAGKGYDKVKDSVHHAISSFFHGW